MIIIAHLIWDKRSSTELYSGLENASDSIMSAKTQVAFKKLVTLYFKWQTRQRQLCTFYQERDFDQKIRSLNHCPNVFCKKNRSENGILITTRYGSLPRKEILFTGRLKWQHFKSWKSIFTDLSVSNHLYCRQTSGRMISGKIACKGNPDTIPLKDNPYFLQDEFRLVLKYWLRSRFLLGFNAKS